MTEPCFVFAEISMARVKEEKRERTSPDMLDTFLLTSRIEDKGMKDGFSSQIDERRAFRMAISSLAV